MGWDAPAGMTVAPLEGMPIAAHYRELVAWQRADALFIRLHLLALKDFPAHERFVLASQLRRAALSVPANIVEGTARIHIREQLQFLRRVSEISCVGHSMRSDYAPQTDKPDA